MTVGAFSQMFDQFSSRIGLGRERLDGDRPK